MSKRSRARRIKRASLLPVIYWLEENGFKILEVASPLYVGELEVSDIDIIAEKDGDKYAVEVKSGSADVSAVRQAYVNARLAGLKPMLIARGVDEKAEAVARQLGVEIISLPDVVIAGTDDLRNAVREAIYSVVADIASLIGRCRALAPTDLETMRRIAESETILDLAESLGMGVEETGKLLGELRRRGLILNGPYQMVRLSAILTILLCSRSGD